MPVAEHLVATTRGGDASLWEPERALWLWGRLRRVPGVLVSETMPDHVHVLARPGAAEVLRRGLIGFTVRFGVRFDMLPPQPANSPAIAMRMARYILFNGVRSGHVDDPFELPWSTLRDLVGATYPIWTPAPMLARVLQVPPAHLVPALLNLADYQVEIPCPQPITVASLDALRAAAASTLRHPPRPPTVLLEEHHPPRPHTPLPRPRRLPPLPRRPPPAPPRLRRMRPIVSKRPGVGPPRGMSDPISLSPPSRSGRRRRRFRSGRWCGRC
jgi:hypothetical protein